jgi:chromosome segregation ATPase
MMKKNLKLVALLALGVTAGFGLKAADPAPTFAERVQAIQDGFAEQTVYYEAQNASIDSMIGSINNAAAARASALASIQSSYDARKAAYEACIADKITEINALTGQNATLQEQVNAGNATIADLNAQIAACDAHVVSLQAQIALLEEGIDQTSAETAELLSALETAYNQLLVDRQVFVDKVAELSSAVSTHVAAETAAVNALDASISNDPEYVCP